MRVLLLAVFICLCACTHAGQCDVFHVSIFPHANVIKQNNIFLITYRETEYRLRGHLSNMSFEAVNQRNVITKMKIADTAFGGIYGQLILKPSKKFPLHDTITIRMSWIDTSKRMPNAQYFPSVIGRYIVAEKADRTPPMWLEDTVSVSTNFQLMQSSAPGYSVTLKLPATDNKHKAQGPLMYKVHIGSLSFFYQSTDMTISDWNGFCEGDIPLQTNTSYKADIVVFDMAGNKNRKTKAISFSVPKYSDAIHVEKDSNK